MTVSVVVCKYVTYFECGGSNDYNSHDSHIVSVHKYKKQAIASKKLHEENVGNHLHSFYYEIEKHEIE